MSRAFFSHPVTLAPTPTFKEVAANGFCDSLYARISGKEIGLLEAAYRRIPSIMSTIHEFVVCTKNMRRVQVYGPARELFLWPVAFSLTCGLICSHDANTIER